MMRKAIAVVFILVFLIAACQGGENNSAEDKAKTSSAKPEYIGFTILSKGIQTGIKESGDFIIKNKDELDSLWKKHYSYMSFVPESPNINFSEDLVIGVFLGEKPSTGYWLRLDSVYVQNNEEIVAMTVNENPDTTREVLSVITYPFLIAAITKTDNDLKFDFFIE
jgi:protease stability complex PrcB-like protein